MSALSGSPNHAQGRSEVKQPPVPKSSPVVTDQHRSTHLEERRYGWVAAAPSIGRGVDSGFPKLREAQESLGENDADIGKANLGPQTIGKLQDPLS